MSIETEFLHLVTDLDDCPQFNTVEIEKINTDKFLCLTYIDEQINGVYIYKQVPEKIVTLWTISEEINND